MKRKKHREAEFARKVRKKGRQSLKEKGERKGGRV